MRTLSSQRAGVAAIAAGVFFFVGQAGELVFGSDSDALNALFVSFGAAGLVALLVAIWNLRELLPTRAGRAGFWLSLVGALPLVAFAVQAVVSVARTGDVPENFILFLLGFLFLIIGQPLMAFALRRFGSWLWAAPLVGMVGAIVAISVGVDPIHDIGLFVFEGAWVAFGTALLRRT